MVRIMDFQGMATSGVTMDFSKQKESKLNVIEETVLDQGIFNSVC